MQLDRLLLVLIPAALLVIIWQMHRRQQAFRDRMRTALGATSESETGLLDRIAAMQDQQRAAGVSSARLANVLEMSTVGVVVVDGRSNNSNT